MFAEWTKKLGALFVATEDYERDTWLASSVDLADLEHRIHNFEMHADPMRWYASGALHDWRA